jgi:hypothetical protein
MFTTDRPKGCVVANAVAASVVVCFSLAHVFKSSKKHTIAQRCENVGVDSFGTLPVGRDQSALNQVLGHRPEHGRVVRAQGNTRQGSSTRATC